MYKIYHEIAYITNIPFLTLHKIKNTNPLNVHVKCKKNYPCWKKALACAKKLEEEREKKKPLTRHSSELVDDDFEPSDKCLICSQDLSDATIKKYKKRGKAIKFSFLKEESTRFTLYKAAETLKDVSSEACNLFNRTAQLSAADFKNARYHRNCFTRNIRDAERAVETKKKEDCGKYDKCLLFIADYIKNNEDECQFSVNEILNYYEGEKPEMTHYFKNRMIDFFGNDIVLHKSKDGLILCYKNISDKILSDCWLREPMITKIKIRKKNEWTQ